MTEAPTTNVEAIATEINKAKARLEQTQAVAKDLFMVATKHGADWEMLHNALCDVQNSVNYVRITNQAGTPLRGPY